MNSSASNPKVWRNSEADAYFERNRSALESFEHEFTDELLRLAIPLLRAGDTVLEVGCANAWRLRRLTKSVPGLRIVAGVDLSPLALQDAYKRGSSAVVLADATALPFATNSMDFIILGFV